MTVRRVLVIWANPLFHEALRRLLAEPGIAWLGSTSDRRGALALVQELKPDTVIIEQEGPDLPQEVLEILQASPPELRLIRMSLSDNDLTIYHHEQVTVVGPGDLLRLIQGVSP